MYITHCWLWCIALVQALIKWSLKNLHMTRKHRQACAKKIYRKVSNVRHTLVGNKIVDHSDVVGHCLSALFLLHLHSQLNMWLQWIGQRQLQDKMRNVYVWGLGASYIRELTVMASNQSTPTSNGSWCIGIKGEMSGTVCVTFTWDIYIYMNFYSFCLFCCLFIIVTWWYMWCIVWQVASKRKYRHVW